jgi:hypothetical protein
VGTAADWEKLTIPLVDSVAEQWLGFWDWLLDKPLTPLELTRFGDWFLSDEANAVYRLDILEGSLEPVCASRAEFARRRPRDAELLDWYQDGMVYAMFEAGSRPGPSQGFGYGVPPALGGSLTRENIVVVDAGAWQLFMAQLHDKLRFVPPSARIKAIEIQASGELKLISESETKG